MIIFLVLTVLGCTWISLVCANHIRSVLIVKNYLKQLNTYGQMLDKYYIEAEKCTARGDNLGRVQALKAHRDVKLRIVELTEQIERLR